MYIRTAVFKRMALAFLVSAVPLALIMTAVQFGLTGDGVPSIEIFTLSVAVGLLVASFTALPAMFAYSANANAIFASDPSSRRPVTRVVTWGRSDALSPEQRAVAAVFARHLSEWMPVQFLQSFLVILAVSAIQVPNIVQGDTEPFFLVIAAIIGVCLVVAIVLFVVQYRAVRRYASAHARQ